MNIRLWFRLFVIQSLFLLVMGVSFLLLAIYGFKACSISVFLGFKVWGVPFYLVALAGIFSISAIYSSLLTLQLMEPFEAIRAKINWLLLGKYHHTIFDKTGGGQHWYDHTYSMDQEVNDLRMKMLQFSKDLQELSAAPVFVGEDTREEIIEHERQRIARELHDSVSQQLFAATMMISAVNEQLDSSMPDGLVKQVNLIEDVIGNAQTEMRALLLHLRPIELANKSLKKGIEQLLLELQTKIPMKIQWDLDDVKLETGIEDHLFRISQEAISNTLRHAKAKKLEVYLSQNIDAVHLKIIDDGVGFNVDKTHCSGRYGLMNIRERVTNMGGNCRIISHKNQGTLIDITVPNSKQTIQGGQA